MEFNATNYEIPISGVCTCNIIANTQQGSVCMKTCRFTSSTSLNTASLIILDAESTKLNGLAVKLYHVIGGGELISVSPYIEVKLPFTQLRISSIIWFVQK